MESDAERDACLARVGPKAKRSLRLGCIAFAVGENVLSGLRDDWVRGLLDEVECQTKWSVR
jgi:hypothetical protein